MSNVGKILEAAGCSFDDVVKCGCYIADIQVATRFNRTYAEFFSGIIPLAHSATVLWGRYQG